tara:strand:+ start:6238 stop:7191 length:954 start_codon:yes stop_codon:yes gene_type:complete
MLENFIKKIISFSEYLFTFKHFIKLTFFKSPMDINSSFKYLIYKTKSQIIFYFKKREKSYKYLYEAKNYNSLGFSTFSSEGIQKNSKIILEKILSINNPWDSNNELRLPASKIFREELINIFKSGVDDFVKASFKSDYKIFYHLLYISKRKCENEIPSNSALWHADGGPGICMNLMICHTPINKLNGAMKVIPWKISKNLLTKLYLKYKIWFRNLLCEDSSKISRKELRSTKCDFLKDFIQKKKIKYFQPKSKKNGLVYAFRNNCVHAGGFTENGHERIVSILHIYPSNQITSLEEKFSSEHLKKSPFPSPAEIFKN